MAIESWDDAMFWNGSLIGYMAGVKSACKDEDKSSLLLRMADTQARLEFMESENAKLRELATEIARFIQAGEQDCGLCKHYDECWVGEAMEYSPNGCVICNEARELGIEVEK